MTDFKQPRLNGWIYVLVGMWIIVVGSGMLLLANYVNQPGTSREAPAQRPTNESDSLLSSSSATGHTTGPYHLAMFVHPRCPCSSASVRELARLMASCQGRLTATVYCYRPAKESDAWIEGSLHDAAAAIPGVVVQSDPAGDLAQQYGAETSGHVTLYDPAGKLCFQGGITAGRGHEGDNYGADTVRACVLGKAATPGKVAPVFGCELETRNEEGR